jgi:hypothetical protein
VSDASDKFDGGGMVLTQCSYCRHEQPDGGCPAFPGGIPDAILRNDLDHSRPVDGDRGIRFGPREGVPADVLARLRRKLDAVASARRGVGDYLGAKLGGEG